MAVLSVQNIVPGGVASTYGSAGAGGDTVAAAVGEERVFIHVKNGGGSSITVTVNPVNPTTAKVPGVGNVTVPAISVAVPNSGERMIGPFGSAYIDSAGNVNVAYSGVTSVTVGAFRLGALV